MPLILLEFGLDQDKINQDPTEIFVYFYSTKTEKTEMKDLVATSK